MSQNFLKDLNKIFNFFHKISKLKSTWRFSERKKMPKESSADHSWRLALMVFVIADELKINIQISRAVKIALVHDIAESITGDIDALLIFKNKISKIKKQKLEHKAISELRLILPPKIGSQIYGLWSEYGKGLTREAKFVKALDKLETLAHFYEVGFKVYNEPEFIPNYADEAVRNFPELADALRFIKRRLKSEFEKGGIPWKKEYDNF